MDSLHVELTDAKALINQELAGPPEQSCRCKATGHFGELETNSHKSQHLLLLVSKTLPVPWSHALVERTYGLMPSRWPGTRNQCDVDWIRAEQQVSEI